MVAFFLTLWFGVVVPPKPIAPTDTYAISLTLTWQFDEQVEEWQLKEQRTEQNKNMVLI